jgi:hypothetical protein
MRSGRILVNYASLSAVAKVLRSQCVGAETKPEQVLPLERLLTRCLLLLELPFMVSFQPGSHLTLAAAAFPPI